MPPDDPSVSGGAGDRRTASGRAGQSGGIPAILFAGGLLGALLLIAAEFTTLFDVRTPSGPLRSVATGSHHSYAMLLLAVLAAVLAFAAFREGSRAAHLAIGAVGVIALLIALVHDLPDAQASGLVGSSKTHFSQASAQPSAGLYLETLGAVLLVIASGAGFLLLAPSRRDD